MSFKPLFSRRAFGYLGASALVVLSILVLCTVVSRIHLHNVVKSYRLATLRSFEPYKMILENARWPAQKADRLLLAHDKLSPEDLTSVESQMLQVSFGIDYDYFMLRSKGETRVEIQKGALHHEKSLISIPAESTFGKNASDLQIRPCTISGRQYACLLAFPLEGESIHSQIGSYLVVGISPDELISKSKYAQVASSLWLPAPTMSFRIGAGGYPFSRPLMGTALFHYESTIDEGIDLVGVVSLRSVLLSTLVCILTLCLTVLPLAWIVQFHVKRRVREKTEIALLNSRVSHADELNRLVKGVIHDIKSPLSALTLISQSPHNEGATRLMDHVIKRMKLIIRDLEAKANHKVDDGDSAVLPFHSVLNLAVSEKEKELGRTGALRLQLPDRPVWVRGRFSEVMRMLSNLINNAAEASPPQFPIDLKLELIAGGNLQLSILDQGKGIPAHVLKQIRETGGTYGKKQGSGIGLRHARETVDRMSGSLCIESEAGIGTEVRITLPECSQPSWAVEELDLRDIEELVLIDDEGATQSALWEHKLRGTHIPLAVFNHPSEVPSQFLTSKKHLFIVDNSFGTEVGLGLKFLEENRTAQSVLVTADWQAAEIQRTMESLQVQLCGKEFIEQLKVVQ